LDGAFWVNGGWQFWDKTPFWSGRRIYMGLISAASLKYATTFYIRAANYDAATRHIRFQAVFPDRTAALSSINRKPY